MSAQPSRPVRRAPLRFLSLRIRRAPGFPHGGPRLPGLVAGINLVSGANGAGKTTSALALQSLLWAEGPDVPAWSDDAAARARLHLEGEIEVGDDLYRAELRDGTLRYWLDGEQAELPEIPPHSTRDRYALSLAGLLNDSGIDLATAIARELAGGYDLRLARESAGFKDPSTLARRAPRKLVEAFQAAAGAVAEIKRAQEALQHEEERLGGLRAERDAARQAQGRVAQLQAALEHARADAACRETEARLEAFPEVFDHLHGKELDELEEQERNVDDLRRRGDEAAARLAQLAEDIAETRLPEAGVPGELPETLEGHVEELRQLEEDLRAVYTERSGAKETASQALAEVDAEGDLERFRESLAGGGLDAALPPLDDLLQRSEDLGGQSALYNRAAAALGPPPSVETGGATDPGPPREAARQLRQWLEASGPFPPLVTGLALVVVAAVPLVQAYFLSRQQPWWWLPAAAAALVLLILAGRLGATKVRRSQLQGDLLTAAAATPALPQPEHWQPSAVRRTLAQLEQDWGEALEARLREEVWQRVGVDPESLALGEEELARQRNEVAERVGLAPGASTLKLAIVADRLRSLLRAVERLGEREAQERSLTARRDTVLERLGDELPTYGYEPPRDLAAARGAVRDLIRRVGSHAEARREHRTEARRLSEEIEPALAGAEAKIEAQLTRLGLGTGADERTAARQLLRDWIAQLDEVRELRADRQRAQGERAAALRALDRACPEDAERQALLACGPGEIENELEAASRRAENLEALSQEITAIETRVADARASRSLQTALAQRDAARTSLAEARDADLSAVAGWVLTDYLSRESQNDSLPPVLARARELFSSVTRERYELRVAAPVGSDGRPQLRAFDAEHEVTLELGQLSTGTRLQLLISARMAFVEHQERGASLPLLLDETLAVADPERAEALITALAALARQGRQIFCFTAQPEEVARWQRVLADVATASGDLRYRHLHLGEARHRVLASSALAPAPRATVPRPEGRDRHAYAALLGVPAIDPWAGGGSEGAKDEVAAGDGLGGIHLWHLISDPEELYPLLAAGFSTWGPARRLLEGGRAEAAVPGCEAILRRAQARSRALSLALEQWRVGRGKPVERHTLEASGAVSSTFLDAVAELARELVGDARALLLALEDKQVKGFLTAKREELERFLLEGGYLDPAPPRPREEVRVLVLTHCAEDLEASLLGVEDLDDLLHQLYAGGAEPALRS